MFGFFGSGRVPLALPKAEAALHASFGAAGVDFSLVSMPPALPCYAEETNYKLTLFRGDDICCLMSQKAMTESLAYDLINPVTLEPAIAPHVAAAQAGKTITAQRLIGFCRGLQMRPADLMLVEGAGGWRVPLNDRETFAAVPRELEMPVILVVALKLGSINHAMLTAEAIRADGLRIAGWVANRPEQEPMSCERETLEYLLNHLGAPCLGVLPWVASGDPAELAVKLELQPLFEN